MGNSTVKICRLVDGSLAIGQLNDSHLCNAATILVDCTEEGNKVTLVPFFYPFSNALDGMDIPMSRVIAYLKETPSDIKNEYLALLIAQDEGDDETPPPKPKATLTRIK